MGSMKDADSLLDKPDGDGECKRQLTLLQDTLANVVHTVVNLQGRHANLRDFLSAARVLNSTINKSVGGNLKLNVELDDEAVDSIRDWD